MPLVVFVWGYWSYWGLVVNSCEFETLKCLYLLLYKYAHELTLLEYLCCFGN